MVVMTDLTPDCNLLGKPAFVEIKDVILHNQRIGKILIRKNTSSKFLYWIMLSPTYLIQIKDKATGSTVRHTSNSSIYSTKIPLPPTIEEQATIATVLNDTDTLIEHLEKLIAKKRAIKQGTMQQLLTGKKRLPGFSGEWSTKCLRDISFMKGRIGWQGLKQTEFTVNADEPYLITGMNFKDGKIRWDEVYHVSNERYEIAKEIQLKPNDILMTKDGTIGKLLFVDIIPFPGKATLNSHLLVFRPIRDSYDPKFLYYQLASKAFKDYIELSKSGSTFFGISQESVGSYPVFLPSTKSEQTAIATILSDMDAEIENLEQKRDKYIMLKQGMMQQLLTGRIRIYANN